MKNKTDVVMRKAQAKVTKLLRGIDNNTAEINKRVAAVAKDTGEFRNVIAEISSAVASVEAPKPSKKPEPTVKTVKKPAKKEVAKAAKTDEKAAKPVKTAKPAPVKKPAAAAAKKPAVAKKNAPKAEEANGKTPLRPILHSLLDRAAKEAGKPVPLTAAELFNQVKAVHPFSRQSVYSNLGHPSFKRIGDTYVNAGNNSKTSDEEAENFVSQVDSTAATATVT